MVGTELNLELSDCEWNFEYTDHDRQIARAIVFDDDGFFILYEQSEMMISEKQR